MTDIEARALIARQREALHAANLFTVLFLAFIGRDRGTPRLDGALDLLTDNARLLETALHSVLEKEFTHGRP